MSHANETAALKQADGTAGTSVRVGLFGARKKLRQVEAAGVEAAVQNAALVNEVVELRTQVAELRGKDALALEAELGRGRAELVEARKQLAAYDREAARVRDGAEQQAAAVREGAEKRAAGLLAQAEGQATTLRADVQQELRQTQSQLDDLRARLDQTQEQVVQTEEVALLQEAGIYEYRHPLADAVAYKPKLAELKDQIKNSVRNGSAVLSSTSWTVSGSAAQGRKLVRDFSKLMLRAYNSEADNCVRSMRPHRLTSSIERLNKSREVIARLGNTMSIRISDEFHWMRVRELELMADYLAKVEEEKERIRAERERQRDEDAARREFEREKIRLIKEQAHWFGVQEKWSESNNTPELTEAAVKLDEIATAILDVESREANIRTGWVYIISNVGSFGDQMVKIGLTRRLDPKERVRELGDASVPFKFDIHALLFSEDAVSLENKLHRALDDRRVNRVNLRREFFRATPKEVLQVLEGIDLKQHLFEYAEEFEAQEWRTSVRVELEAKAL
jgi:Meiotically up-regulated gene 113/Domain of unknown function (DUF4041)